jgi:aromatic ring-opening dioxygenase catalytic subunit (LigB family)
MSAAATRFPSLFIPHGGGPWPFLDGPMGRQGFWRGLDGYLRGLDAALGARPKALLVISGHWEAPRPTLSTAKAPGMLYDYYGFPEHTYRIDYPAPGAPDLAPRVEALLAAAGLASDEDAERGYDHGTFVPLMVMYPDADIPVLQLSLRDDLDPAAHIALGRALAPLRDEGVLILGSGLSYHNLRGFFSRDPGGDVAAQAFDDWLTEAVEQADIAERDRRLTAWETAPGARACHPREEHLLPLMVAAGAGGADQGRRTFSDKVNGKAISAFQFG